MQATAVIELIKAGMPSEKIEEARAALSPGQKGTVTKWEKNNLSTKTVSGKAVREVISQKELRLLLKAAQTPQDALRVNQRFTTAKGDMVALFRPLIMVSETITTIQESVSAVRSDSQPATSLSDGFARRKAWKGSISGRRVRLSFQWKLNGEALVLDELDSKGKAIPAPIPMINIGNEPRQPYKLAIEIYPWLSEALYRA